MPRQLWLLRHGEAVSHGTRATDAERELTPRGEHQAQTAGRALARLGIHLTACVTSPKVRARDTARIACEALDLEAVEDSSLAGDFDVEAAGHLFATIGGEDAHLLVVGHNPDFPQVVYDLTGANVDLKKGGIAAVKLTGAHAGELLVLLRPRELELLAQGDE